MMLNRLVELESVIRDMAHPQMMLSDYQWQRLKYITAVLEEPFKVTKALQAEDLSPGKFFNEWKRLMNFLSRNGDLGKLNFFL